jgi:hypothetical protein
MEDVRITRQELMNEKEKNASMQQNISKLQQALADVSV